MLKLQYKDHRQAAIWLSDERFTIGQDRNNDLALQEPGVAPFHAEIRRQGKQYFLLDTGNNGTFVNDERIEAQYQLRAGDTIKIANVHFELHAPQNQSTAPQSTEQKWAVQAITGQLKGQHFPIIGSMTVGRSKSCEIRTKDDRISRRHSELQLKDGLLKIKDLGSANGTVVNRKKINELTLNSGDQIQFDDITFLVIGPKKQDTAIVEEEDDATVFAISPPTVSPIKKNTAVTSPKKPQRKAPVININPEVEQQISMAGVKRAGAAATQKARLMAFILVAAGCAVYWFFLR